MEILNLPGERSKAMDKNTPLNKSFVFGNFQLNNHSQTLFFENTEVHMAKRPLNVLFFLIENRERLVSRNELLDKFWDGKDVYDDSLRKTIGAIRKALNDLEKPPQFIETRWGSGYRFIGKVSEKTAENGSTVADEGKETDTGILKLAENSNGNKPSSLNEKNIKDDNQRRAKITNWTFLRIIIGVFIFFIGFGFYLKFSNGENLQPAEKTGSETAASVRSIAVLPLKNLTGDANNEYLTDGITESIITELSRVQELKVISRSSTFTLKNKESDPRRIGQDFGVDAFLEGSVQKKDEVFSVNVRLISTRDGTVLWTSRDFERSLSNAFELQEIISDNIAIELRAELSDSFQNRNTADSDAYQAYLKGRYQWNKRTAEGIRKSIELYQQAINFDSHYALAYAGLAESYVQGIWYVPFEATDVLPKAEKAARTAIELNDSLAEAHTALASVLLLNWNWPETERELRHAVELNPRYARAHHVQAFLFLTLGRYDEAIASIRRAKELDPLNLIIITDEANILYCADQTEEAFKQWNKAIELDPNSAYTYRERSIAYQDSGNKSASIEDYSKFLELSGKSAEEIAEYRRITSRNGFNEIWRRELNEILAKQKQGKKISYLSVAVYYALLGQKDKAFDYLEKAYTNHSAELVLLKPYKPLTYLHSDPRFISLLNRMGLSD